jgi:hypothetical protein
MQVDAFGAEDKRCAVTRNKIEMIEKSTEDSE